jgi:hypothetical protein
MKYLVLIALFIVSPAYASDVSLPEDNWAQYVVDHLDLTSTPSLLMARREKGKKTFKDYDFLPTKITDNTASLEETDKSWSFYMTILGHSDDKLTICLLDKEEKEGGHYAQTALELTQDGTGFLKATKPEINLPDCLDYTE